MAKTNKIKTEKNLYVIGVDGGGTKTAVALADMDGKIVSRALSGSAAPRNVGLPAAIKNLTQGISQVIKGKKNVKVISIFIGIPDIEEEYKNDKTAIVKQLKNQKKLAKLSAAKLNIASDQLVAFRSGAAGKDGIVSICGTGTATHGWNGGREALVNNQGWVSKGGAKWIGDRVMEAVCEFLDGRGEKTVLAEMIFKKYKTTDIHKILKLLYLDSKTELSSLAVLCDQAAGHGDKMARQILVCSGKEIARSVRVAAAKLRFFDPVPLVLAGGVYKSRWVADTAMDDIERYYPGKFDFVVIADPVIGAVRLALEATVYKS